MAKEPKWLSLARTQMGQKEVAGNKDNPEIMKYYKAAKQGGIKHDETAWCSAFANWVMRQDGFTPTYSLLARSWLKWGKACEPVLGAIMVFSRGDNPTYGHVGFYVGETKTHYLILGGNQSNMVSIVKINKSKFLGARWPITVKNSNTVKGLTASMGTITASQTIQPLFDGLSQIQPDLMSYSAYVPALTWAGVAIGLALAGWALYKRVKNIQDVNYDTPEEDEVEVEEFDVDDSNSPAG